MEGSQSLTQAWGCQSQASSVSLNTRYKRDLSMVSWVPSVSEEVRPIA